jgi:hypothetical protein
VAKLNSFVREMFPEVDMLGTLATADNVVAPFDARVVVFIDRRVSRWGESHVLERRSEIDDFHSRRRRSVVFRFGRRQSNGLL